MPTIDALQTLASIYSLQQLFSYVSTSVEDDLNSITLRYELRGAFEVVSDRLSILQAKICQDSLSLIDLCKTDDELDFLFPEIARICEHDLAVLNSWQNDVNWKRSLPPS